MFHEQPCLWVGSHFVKTSVVAKHWQHNGPYMFHLPDMLSECKHLVKALNIKEEFSALDYLLTFSDMANDYPNQKLPEEFHKIIKSALLHLNLSKHSETPAEVYLPDNSFCFHLATSLSYNDAPWCAPQGEFKFVHELLQRKTALAIGVKEIRDQILSKYLSDAHSFAGVPFGQKEDLTRRISNILRDYPLDATLLKELLQNADDAKASHMCVILDKRQHKLKRVLSENWTELQGPAVLVWNDAEFSERDLKGIQELGMGSKRDDAETIGQFGIGFNVVYHLTDCPSFITGGKTMCILDPHCRYVPGANEVNPGRRYDELDGEFWSTFSDMRSAYLKEKVKGCPFDFSSKGSLFRFPLRHTKKLVMQSKVLDNKVTTEPKTGENMFSSLQCWVGQVKDALLFLNNVTKFQFFVIEEGKNELELCTKYEISLTSKAQHTRQNLTKRSQKFKSSKDPQPFVLNYPLTITTSANTLISHSSSSVLLCRLRSQSKTKIEEHTEQWFVQQGIGDLRNESQVWKFIEQTLPKHGIAAQLDPPASFTGKVFCFLPLPITSNLPVHVNGQFVLNSNRRGLWSSDIEDDKSQWNSNLIDALSSSYAQFVVKAQQFFLGGKISYTTVDEAHSIASKCYSVFPFWKPESRNSSNLYPEKEWKNLATSTFKKLWDSNAVVLASVKFDAERNCYQIQWNEFVNQIDQFHQAYFMPPKPKFDQNVQKVLQRLGMTLTCAPFRIKEHLEELELSPKAHVHVADEREVFDHYATFYQRMVKCSNYPCSIDKTPFENVDDFMTFLKYVLLKNTDEALMAGGSYYKFPSHPWNLPLLLSAQGCLDVFNQSAKLLCSKYSKLFPENTVTILASKGSGS